MQLIHPQLPLFILEVFLPPHYNSNGCPETILKPFVSSVAQELSNSSNVGSELARAEDSFLVRSPSGNDENVVFFDIVRRNGGAMNINFFDIVRPYGKTLMPVVRDHDDQVFVVEEDTDDAALINVVEEDTDDAAAINEQGADTSKLNPDATENMEVSDMPLSLVQQASLEADNDHSNIALHEITFTMIEKYFGRNLVDAANKLGVSRSTLKRKCRSFGIQRWPSHKRNKVYHLQPIPEPPMKAVMSGTKVSRIGNRNAREKKAMIPTSEKGTSNGMVYAVIIKATHGDNIVRFPFPSSSGIHDLCHELGKRFKLEVDNFVVKYEDDGDLILIACDEDLHFHMDTLKASNQTIMYLLVLQ